MKNAPIIFLAGPPGVGKSTFGCSVCDELNLRFADVMVVAGSAATEEVLATTLETLVTDRAADVIELPWDLQLRKGIFKYCRCHGELHALWDHPLEMQKRSGHAKPLFTPKPERVPTQGGFGRLGTACPEYRRLERACTFTLSLIGLSQQEARHEVLKSIRLSLQPVTGTIVEQEGIADWPRSWCNEYDADPQAARILAEAMARFIQQLRQEGLSPRSLNSIYSDLEALGQLNFAYNEPKAKTVLNELYSWDIEYNRKYAFSPKETQRYLRSYKRFKSFLNRK